MIIFVKSEELKFHIDARLKNEKDVQVIVESNFNQSNLIKEMKKYKHSSLIKVDEQLRVDMIYLSQSAYKSIENFNLDIIILNKKNIDVYDVFHDKVDDISCDFGGLSYKENKSFDVMIDKLNILFSGKAMEIYKNATKDSVYKYTKFFISENKTSGLNSLIDKSRKSENITGLGKLQIINETKESVVFSEKKSLIKIVIDDKKRAVVTILTKDKSEIDIHYYHKGIVSNIISNVSEIMTNGRTKIKKSDLIISSVGTVLFLLLTVMTFTYILNPSDVEDSFNLLFNHESWTSAWIYLMWMNFIFSFVFGFILTFIISWISTKKKPSMKTAFAFFVSAQLKATASFVTGEAIIGTILWAWYITKNSSIRTTGLISIVALGGIIRAIANILLITPFLIFGSVYLVDLLNDAQNLNLSMGQNIDSMFTWTVIVLGWGGMLWTIIHNLALPCAALLLPSHIIYNYFYTKVILFKKESNIIGASKNREISLLNLKRSSRSLFENKDRIYRIGIMVIVLILIESLEMTYAFNIVEDSMFKDNSFLIENNIRSSTYANFIYISGLRTIITNVHNFPLLNVIPGNGMALSEFLMKNIYDVVFISQHSDLYPLISNPLFTDDIVDISLNFSVQSTFIIRFFNVYLPRIISFIITLMVIAKLIIKKMKR